MKSRSAPYPNARWIAFVVVAVTLASLLGPGCVAHNAHVLYTISNNPHETGRQQVWPYFLAGKPTVVAFWNTDNMQCLRDVAGIRTLESRDSPVQLVTVANGVSPFEIQKWLQKEQISYPVLLDLDQALSAKLGVNSVPMFLLFDVDGQEVARAYDLRVVHNWFDRERWRERVGLVP